MPARRTLGPTVSVPREAGVFLLMLLAFLGPRFGILVYWIGWPARWQTAFDTTIAPLLGFFFAPWLTFVWVLVAPSGVEDLDYVLLGLAGLADIATLGGGGHAARQRDGRASAPVY
jgi:hypothetical protein